jgi:hypothetical protein
MAPSDAADADDGRNETSLERLDRNTIELLNELRVASTGIQFMFAFLLVVPFNSAFKQISSFEKTVYFVTLLCVAVSAVLLIAPSVHYRILFRQGEKRYLVSLANRLAISGLVFLGFGFTGILVLLSDFVVGGLAPVVVGVLAFVAIAILWFAIPLQRRIRHPHSTRRQP